eukprot:1574711-Amphidinium_carterae.1
MKGRAMSTRTQQQLPNLREFKPSLELFAPCEKSERFGGVPAAMSQDTSRDHGRKLVASGLRSCRSIAGCSILWGDAQVLSRLENRLHTTVT